jgi:hypothetical protein
VLVSNLREKQEGAIDKPGTEKIRLTLVKPASGNGGEAKHGVKSNIPTFVSSFR